MLRGCWACFVLPARGKGVPSLSVGCVALCQVFHPSGRAAPGGLCTGLMPHFSQVVGRHALPPAHAHHSCVTCQKGTLILTSLLEDLDDFLRSMLVFSEAFREKRSVKLISSKNDEVQNMSPDAHANWGEVTHDFSLQLRSRCGGMQVRSGMQRSGYAFCA